MIDESYLGKNIDSVREIQQKVRDTIQQYMNKVDIPIENSKVTYTSPVVIQSTQARPTERGEVRKNYNELLNLKIRDEKLKQKAIDYAEIMIQPTTFCKLTLKTDSGQDAILKVICCLPEHAQKMVSWWIKKDIDSNNLPIHASQFHKFMQPDRIARVHVQQSISGSATVTQIIPVFNFA